MSLINVRDATPVEIDRTRILQALKLNPYDPKTQALLLVCERYGLDPLLKHMVLIDGNPYVTRDGYLHVAHSSGRFDGMTVDDEGADASEWWAKISVYRKDMSRPFTFTGRYPRSGSNKKHGPAMAIKCAEVMALRRAFDVTGVAAADEIAWDTYPTPSSDDDGATHEQRERINELSAALNPDQKIAARRFVDDHGIELSAMTSDEADTVIAMLLDLPADPVGEVDVVSSGDVDSPQDRVPMSDALRGRLLVAANEHLIPPADVVGSDARTEWRDNALLDIADDVGVSLTSVAEIDSDLAKRLIEMLESGDVPPA